ncbi:hypothetical protein BDB01DRAFT_847664 [Pilobolus umbonatus]|nr:hypothetical protein BDB01DRAFT_847664 [Pilobolus umbonatus]
MSHHEETSQIIEDFIHSIDQSAPINLSFITQPISKAITDRIRSIETLYDRFLPYRFLKEKGIHPVILFLSFSGTLSLGMRRIYSKHTHIVITSVGVFYPAQRCWKIIKDINETNQLHQLQEMKSWLTYWLLFGSIQVLDTWMEKDLIPFNRDKYNLYKLLLLYWAQSPHSNGASLLYRYVLQKPANPSQPELIQPMPMDMHKKEYRYLDGYTPPNLLLGQSREISSDDDDSVGSLGNTITASTLLSQEKEPSYPLLMNPSEAAW